MSVEQQIAEFAESVLAEHANEYIVLHHEPDENLIEEILSIGAVFIPPNVAELPDILFDKGWSCMGRVQQYVMYIR